MIKCGSAAITMKKDGTITIEGKDITVKGRARSTEGDGEITAKGSKDQQQLTPMRQPNTAAKRGVGIPGSPGWGAVLLPRAAVRALSSAALSAWGAGHPDLAKARRGTGTAFSTSAAAASHHGSSASGVWQVITDQDQAQRKETPGTVAPRHDHPGRHTATRYQAETVCRHRASCAILRPARGAG